MATTLRAPARRGGRAGGLRRGAPRAVGPGGLTLEAIGPDNHRVSPAAAEVGSTANSYQILAKLAAGGMAEIFLARGAGVAGVERYCVLKRILRDRATDAHFVRMFLDEARLAAQLQHPNIAQVYDIGKLGDSYFFTMEYVHGETVRALLHRAQGLRRMVPIHCVLTIAAGTAAGLHHAHDRLGLDGRALGIVHRDVSPSNLMVGYEGGVKVVDFGVAKAADRGHETKSGTVKGKISYLSPEQCRGKRVDRRSDLFSLGICFWEMLTAERLYKRATDFENMTAIVNEATPPPSARRPDVPAEVDALVMRLLSKEPDARFQTAEELIEAIEGVAARTSTVLSPSALGRFVRELFGQRPEPWLEIDGHDAADPVTVTSEPIPRELALAMSAGVDQQLAGVIDLSARASVTESLDALPGSGSVALRAAFDPTVELGKRATLDLPEEVRSTGAVPAAPSGREALGRAETLRSPPSSGARIAVPEQPPGREATLSLSAHALTEPAPAASAPATSASSSSVSVSRPSATSASAASASATSAPVSRPSATSAPATRPSVSSPESLARPLPPPPPGPAAALRPLPLPPPPITMLGVSTPVGSTPTPIALTPMPPLPGAADATTGAPSGSFVASSGSLAVVRTASSLRMASRGRTWPIYAVIAGAALAGSIAMVLVMRGGDATEASEAPTGSRTTPASTTAQISVEPIVEPPAAAVSPPVADPTPVDPAARPVDVAPVPDDATARVAAAPAPSTPAAPAPTAKSPGAARGVPRHAAPARPTTVPPPGAAVRAPDDEIARAFAAAKYDQVVAQCRERPVSAAHAPACVLAACHLRNEAAARKLLVAAPAARRAGLIATCQALGVDLAATPIAKPVDCEADPMACQH